MQVGRDERLLATLDDKLQLVRDRVPRVTEGYANGFYLWGEGGTSKSYTVEQTLKSLSRTYKLSNSRLEEAQRSASRFSQFRGTSEN